MQTIKNILLKSLFCLLLLSLGISRGWCQTATLYGKLTDKRGRTISDAKISVANTKNHTTSNEKGDYELVIPADTNITIEFSHVSFGIRLKSVHLSAGKKERSDLETGAPAFGELATVGDGSAPAFGWFATVGDGSAPAKGGRAIVKDESAS